jgi:hypothetical protein
MLFGKKKTLLNLENHGKKKKIIECTYLKEIVENFLMQDYISGYKEFLINLMINYFIYHESAGVDEKRSISFRFECLLHLLNDLKKYDENNSFNKKNDKFYLN